MAGLLAPAHATPSLTHTTRAEEAIGQTRVTERCPERKELLALFIIVGDLRALAAEAIGQIADLLLELNEFLILLQLCAKSRCEL